MEALTSLNFTLRKNDLILNKKGIQNDYTLILFKSPRCMGCKKFSPVFEQLAREYGSVIRFAFIDISIHRNVLAMARKSKTPINHVPFLLLYAGNMARAKYTGNMGISSLRSFLEEMARTGNVSTFTPTNLQRQRPQEPQQFGHGVMDDHDDDDEDTKLLCPVEIIPHNTPWVGEYKKLM